MALNSIFQMIMYSFYAYFMVFVLSEVISPGIGVAVAISIWAVGQSVFIYLGIPFIAGVITRYMLFPRRERNGKQEVRAQDRQGLAAGPAVHHRGHVLPAGAVHRRPAPEVIRISIPLLVYFILMFLLSFYLSIMLRFDYPHAVAQTFTASSNNFELTIAVAIGSLASGPGWPSPQCSVRWWRCRRSSRW